MPIFNKRNQNLQNLMFQPGTISPTGQVNLTQMAQQSPTPPQQVAQPMQQPIQQPLQQAVQQQAFQQSPAVQPAQQNFVSQLQGIEQQVRAIEQGLQQYTQQPQPTAQDMLQEEFRARDARLEAIERAILESLQPSPEEQQLRNQIGAVTTGRDLGIQGTLERPIPMEFITGQAAAIERRAATQLRPLQEQLRIEQERRQASLDVGRTKLDIEQIRGRREGEETERMIEIERLEAERSKREDQVNALIKAVEAGQLSLGNIPAELRPEVTRGVDFSRLGGTTPSPQPSPSPSPGTQTKSLRTQQVLERGINNVTLTPSQRSEVELELFNLGMYEESPPQWFIDKIQQERQMSIIPSILQKEWDKYRNKVLGEDTTTTIDDDFILSPDVIRATRESLTR